jgi:hypothetical protein
MQVDLPAQGCAFPGFPKIIGPFGFTDLRASLSWSLVDVASLRNYLAARHNFAAAQFSARTRASWWCWSWATPTCWRWPMNPVSQRGSAGGHGENFARPGGCQPPGRHGAAAR